MTTEKIRYYDLDCIRFIAAMAVILHHYTFRATAADDLTFLPFPLIAPFSKYGFLGVELFFMVSGFVILMSTMNSTSQKFIISRIARLYPAYWVCVTITALFILLFHNPQFSVNITQYLYNLSMLNGFLYIPHVDGVYWTLMVELKFYFLIFILFMTKTIKYLQAFLYLWLILSIGSYIDILPYGITFFIFPEFSGYFIAGATFYLISQGSLSFFRTTLVILSYFLCLYSINTRIEEFDNYYSTELSRSLIYSMITCFFLIFYAVATKKTYFINKPVMLTFGALTYPLYLLHQNIGYLIINQLNPIFNKYFILFITLVIVFALAWSVHHFIERRYGKKFKSFLTNAINIKVLLKSS